MREPNQIFHSKRILEGRSNHFIAENFERDFGEEVKKKTRR